MQFGGFDWDSGNLPKCLIHGVSLPEIEALFRGVRFMHDKEVKRYVKEISRLEE